MGTSLNEQNENKTREAYDLENCFIEMTFPQMSFLLKWFYS